MANHSTEPMIPLRPLQTYQSLGNTSQVSVTVTATSTASDVRRYQIASELERGDYECLVCTEPIHPISGIWSCPSCYNLFHHACIDKWAFQSSRKAWPCPACKAIQSDPGPHAKCWCGKAGKDSLIGPDGLNDGNSCRQVCGKKQKRGDEEGICVEICHLGACSEVFYRGREGPDIAAVLSRRPRPHRPVWSRTRENVASQDPEIPSENSIGGVQQDAHLNWYQRLAKRWKEEVDSEAIALAVGSPICLIVMLGFEAIWTFRRVEKLNQPLRHQEYADSNTAEMGEFFASMFIGIPLLVCPSLFSALGLGFAMDHICMVLFRLEHDSFRRWFLRGLFFLITAGTLATFMVLQVLVPDVTWTNQFKHGCDGFNTHVILDKVVGQGRSSHTEILDSIQLYSLQFDALSLASPQLNTFNFSTPHDITKSKDVPFSTFHRMLGQTSTHTLAVDFDLHHHKWRMLDLSPSQIHSFPSLEHTFVQAESISNILKTGTWTQTSLRNPHLHLPELNLLIPAFRHFSRNRKYQPFMKIYDISGMNNDHIEDVKWRQWSGKNEEGVVMRTYADSHSSPLLRVCFKRGEMDGKGLRDEALVPLGLMAVMRIQKSKDGN